MILSGFVWLERLKIHAHQILFLNSFWLLNANNDVWLQDYCQILKELSITLLKQLILPQSPLTQYAAKIENSVKCLILFIENQTPVSYSQFFSIQFCPISVHFDPLQFNFYSHRSYFDSRAHLDPLRFNFYRLCSHSGPVLGPFWIHSNLIFTCSGPILTHLRLILTQSGSIVPTSINF